MYKLLIVDDEQIEREGMAHFIQWDKYDIQLCGTAWNGADALGKIQKDVPDIVLTDIKMPVMNGIELIQKLFYIIIYILFSLRYTGLDSIMNIDALYSGYMEAGGLHLILHSFDAFSAPYFSGLCIIQCSDNTLYSGNLSYLLKCYCIEF